MSELAASSGRQGSLRLSFKSLALIINFHSRSSRAYLCVVIAGNVHQSVVYPQLILERRSIDLSIPLPTPLPSFPNP